MQCFACFPSLKQLRCHRTATHGVRRPAHQYASGPCCPVCGVDFRTRIRCMEHLERGAAACTAALRAGRILPLAPEIVAAAAAADAAERRSASAEGRDPKCGPPVRAARAD